MLVDYLLIFVPAMVANGSPPILAKILPNLLDIPLDANKEWRGRRILGDHKTWRGLVGGVILAGISFWLVWSFLEDKTWPWYFGLMAGTGALVGDAIKSFFKRQIGVKPGKVWFPWDQIDWVIGFLVVLIMVDQISWQKILFYLTIGFLIHMISKVMGYWLKINETFF